MSICKDCIHYPVCIPYVSPNESFPEVEGGCPAFKDKSDFVDYRNIPYIKADVRADTVRKMQERLNKAFDTHSYNCRDCIKSKVDQVAKEMIDADD